ncbi:MAG: class I SAM-dependent methyltransferase [Vicinamibacterales bacterium]
MISDALLALVRCPECRGGLTRQPGVLSCDACGRDYVQTTGGYLDLRPAAAFAETTMYVDEALHADARHESVSPPLMSAAIRQGMLRRFLDIGPGDRVVDLGCGSGRVLAWNANAGAHLVGVDVSPFFAAQARASIDLTLADLRRLPFADGTFTKGYCLDVLEHLSRDSLRDMLAEAARVIEPGGGLFVYSHVRKNAWVAIGLRGINALARSLERVGLIDMSQERLRKSDHLNPLSDIPDLRRVAGDAGFEIERIRYYTPLVGGFLENIVVRVAERFLAKRAARSLADAAATDESASGSGPDEGHVAAIRAARTRAKDAVARRGPVYVVLRAFTALMWLDVWLFGRIESGPFFVLLTKAPAERDPAVRP